MCEKHSWKTVDSHTSDNFSGMAAQHDLDGGGDLSDASPHECTLPTHSPHERQLGVTGFIISCVA